MKRCLYGLMYGDVNPLLAPQPARRRYELELLRSAMAENQRRLRELHELRERPCAACKELKST